jgi:hypothetical protein
MLPAVVPAGAAKHAYNLFVKYMAMSAPLAAEAWKLVPEADKDLYRQQFKEGPNGLMKRFKDTRLRERLVAKMIDGLVPRREGSEEPDDVREVAAAAAAAVAAAEAAAEEGGAEGGAEAGFDADIDGLAKEVARVALVDAFAAHA